MISSVLRILLIGLLPFLSFSCQGQSVPSERQRLETFNKTVPGDEFMRAFLQFIRSNQLADDLIALETELKNKNFLEGYQTKDLQNYFAKRIRETKDPRCLSRAILDTFRTRLPRFQYDAYRKMLESSGGEGSPEYRFLEYLKSGEPSWRDALEFALRNNQLTADKKYFYLLTTMPARTCD